MDIKSTKKSPSNYTITEILTGAKEGSNAFIEFIFALIIPLFLLFLFAGMGHADGIASIFISKLLHVGVFFTGFIAFLSWVLRSQFDSLPSNTRLIVIYLILSISCGYTILTNPFTKLSEPVTQVQVVTKNQKDCQVSILYKSKSLEYNYCADDRTDLIYIKTVSYFTEKKNHDKVKVVLTANNFMDRTKVSGIEFIEDATFLEPSKSENSVTVGSVTVTVE